MRLFERGEFSEAEGNGLRIWGKRKNGASRGTRDDTGLGGRRRPGRRKRAGDESRRESPVGGPFVSGRPDWSQACSTFRSFLRRQLGGDFEGGVNRLGTRKDGLSVIFLLLDFEFNYLQRAVHRQKPAARSLRRASCRHKRTNTSDYLATNLVRTARRATGQQCFCCS